MADPPVALRTIVREWGRIGCIGFGGPPAHIALLRDLCVTRRGWMSVRDFDDGVATTNLLPGPASTQLAIFCAWRLRRTLGAVVGGLCFICPGLLVIVGLSALFLEHHPPAWILGAAAGAGAAVPAVAVAAALGFVPSSMARMGTSRWERFRWIAYVLAGGVAAATIGSYLILVLVVCGLLEVSARGERPWRRRPPTVQGVVLATAGHVAIGGLAALAWVAFKVGALSYGGGFVIIPLMLHDAVNTYHWMTGAQFLNAVALGQVTPGPVVQTVAVVGYAADGIPGALLAAMIAFAPSFLFILFGGPRFDRIRASTGIQAFLSGAGPAVVGAIGGSAVPLGMHLTRGWQFGLMVVAAVWLIGLRKGVVVAITGSAAIGVALALVGVSV